MKFEILGLLKLLLGHLGGELRFRAGVVLVLMILAAFAEIFSLGLLIPFLGVLLSPNGVLENEYLAPILRRFALQGHEQLVFGVTVLFVAAALAAATVRVALVWCQIRLAYGMGSELSGAIYRRVLSQPYKFHAETNSSQVIADVSRKADRVVNEVILPAMVLVSSMCLISAIAVTLAVINPLVALSAAAGFGVVYLLVMSATRFRVLRYGEVVNRQQAEVIKVLQEALGGIRDIIIDSAQEIYCRIYRRADLPLRRAQANNLIISGSPKYIIEGLSIALIAAFSGWLAIDQGGIQSMIPTLGVLVLGAQKTLPLLQLAYVNVTQIRGGRASLEGVLQVLERPIPKGDKNAVVEFQRNIHFENLWYQYRDDGDWILRGIDLEISKGDRIGFVGKTGSGKSTVLDLIMGLLTPGKGALLIDGLPISDKNCWAWQRHIAHVPQSIYLADATVLENIAFGVPIDEIDFDRARKAAEWAQIAGAIDMWERGYKTVVGERGARLSGGQRQRIGLARAFYKNAEVIILDEATSALDGDTESAVMSAIDTLDSDITLIVVAHRLTTLSCCNKIVHLENGSVKRVGTYADLIGEEVE
jgi:ABC-type multidrug transport system fused ATPase/permease subunit